MKQLSRHLLLMGLMLPSLVAAADLPTFHLVLENHLFFPSELEVPAHTKFKLVIENRDRTAEEFDSFDLNREKVIFPGRSSMLYVGPLEPGRFEFFGEFNSNTAKGTVVAVPAASGGGDADQ